MDLFTSTLSQIAFLFGFIAIGFILAKGKILPENSATVLSKLENNVFIPALVMGTFIENFTVERISAARELLITSSIIALIAAPVAILISKLVTKDRYIQKIYTYGLAFSNFGFMGNAVVMGLFPDIFFEYLIFTLPLWTLIYLWGVPRLLITGEEKQSFLKSLKAFINPMFIAMIIGMLAGVLKIPVPGWIMSLINTSGSCMSPIAMILTGVVVSSISFKKTFLDARIYIITFVRLLLIPLAFIGVATFLNMSETVYICALCSLSMPLGLSTIVIPSAYGKDTSVAAGMTIVSHLLSAITIPFIFAVI